MDREAVQERFGIIGPSAELRKVIDRIRLVARTDISVLITGESGVGKELVAHAIHELSARRHKDMVIVNAGAIPEGLIESELFGAEKGAYTGAVARRTGFFEAADGGSIFLDEVGEMPLNAQVRLLRVLESGEFSRVGGTDLQRTDVRVIAATNKNLGREVEAGRFREDLYYRLSTVQVEIPALRDRREDILPIFEHLHHRFAQQYNATTKQLDEDARNMLVEYYWPGNVRELRNVAEQAVVLLPGRTVGPDMLRPLLRGVGRSGSSSLILASEAREEPVTDARDRELLYRMLIELRLELRELKELVRSLADSGEKRVRDTGSFDEIPLPVVRREEKEFRDLGEPRSLTARPAESDEIDWIIEDAPYEIQSDDDPELEPAFGNGERPLPTMEQAERELILEALRRFDGNRRQSAQALGISERTLYRKLKEIEDQDGILPAGST